MPPRSVTAALMGDPSHGASVQVEALAPKPTPPMAPERAAVSTDKLLGGIEPELSDEFGRLGGGDQPSDPAKLAEHLPQGNQSLRGAEGAPMGGAELSDLSGKLPAVAEQYADPAHCSVRPVAPMEFEGLTLADIPTAEPVLEWMAPGDLLVDETYQRGLGPKGEAQVRRIAEGWDWRRVKPVIVAWTERGFEVLDGQHTAYAAATRGLARIPCMVVEAAELVDRAGAFVGQNRDRIALSAMQLHHAAAAAADPDAVTIEQVCARAGVTLVRSYYGAREYKPGETIAVGVIGGLVKRRGAMRAREILQALVLAGLAPIASNDIKACELLFTDPEFADELEPVEQRSADLAAAIRGLGAAGQREAKELASLKCLPLWKAQASVWFRKTRKRRRAT